MCAIPLRMIFDARRQKIAEAIGPAVESVGNAAAAVIALACVAIVVSVVALVVASKTGRVTG